MRIRKSVAAFIMLALMGVATYVSAQEISRNNEGRYFYTSITIPPGAETMYLSGSGARSNEDGTWGTCVSKQSIPLRAFNKPLKNRGGQ